MSRAVEEQQLTPGTTAAARSPLSHGWQRSSRPWMDSTGQVTLARIASVSSPQDDESDASLNSRFASALVSMTQPTQSSY